MMTSPTRPATIAARSLSRAGVRFVAAIGLFAIASAAFAGPPDLVWSGGGHTGFNATAVTPDGQTLVTGSAYDETIKLWRTSDATLIRTINATYGGVVALAVSPDGQFVASGAYPVFGADEETVKLFRISDGTLVREFHGTLTDAFAVAFSPDGTQLAAAKQYEIEIFRVSDGALLRTLTGHTFNVLSVAWSPNGQLVISGSGDKTARIWRVSDGQTLRTLTGHTSFVSAVAFAPTGKAVATGSFDSTVKLWTVATGALQRTLTGHAELIGSVAFSRTGQLASGSWDGTVKLWNPASGALLRTLSDPSITNVDDVAWTRDGRTLYAGGLDSHAHKWRIQDGALLLGFGHHTAPVTAVVYSPDGTTFASAAKDLSAKIWQASNGTELQALTGPLDVLNGIAYSPDGLVLAAACGSPPPDTRDPRVFLWDTTTGDVLRTLAGHEGGSTVVQIEPDGQTVVSAGRDGTIKFWDLETGGLLDTISGPADPMRAHITPDGQSIAIADSAGRIEFRRLSDGALVKTITSPQSNGLADFALSNDGRLLATGGERLRQQHQAVQPGDRRARAHAGGPRRRLRPVRRVLHRRVDPGVGLELLAGDHPLGCCHRSGAEPLRPETGWGLDPTSSIAFSPLGTTFGYARNDATVGVANLP
jgi:WD40 repeat protein